ncbi:MAG: hypothetical protein J5J00_05505 [Deltaproteobacteria bacterium]|nr:hypothetical protein [Deltaproteobacteria bacterium]
MMNIKLFPVKVQRSASLFSASPGLKLVAWLSAFASSVWITWELFPTIAAGHQSYSEFIAGFLAFQDYYKSGEIKLALIFIGSFLALLLSLWLLLSLIEKKINPAAAAIQPGNPWREREVPLSQIVWLICGFFAARYLVAADLGRVLWGAILLIAGALLISRKGLSLAAYFQVTLLAPLWGVFSCAAIMAAIEAYFPGSTIDPAAAGKFTYLAGAISFVLALLTWGFAQRSLTALLLALQLPLPLLLLRFYRTDLEHISGPLALQFSLSGTIILAFAMVILIGAAARALILQIKRPIPLSFAESIGTSSLVVLAMFFSFSLPPASPFVADDFHLSEMMLPWHQIVEIGKRSYEEFVSIQGYLALTVSFVNELFYDGMANTYYSSSVLTGCLTTAVSVLAAKSLLGKGWALALTPILLPDSNRFYLIPAALMILANPVLISRAINWCLAAVAVVWTCILWNAASGVAIAAAFFPLGLIQLLRAAIASSKEAKIRGAFLAAALIAVIFTFTPVMGVVYFTLENGTTSLVAHGWPWFITENPSASIASHFNDPWKDRLVFEAIRAGGWILGIFLLVPPLIRALRETVAPPTLALVSLSLGYVLFTIVMLPQSMGRVDPPPYLSRTGAHAFLTLAIFIPVTFAFAARHLSWLPFPAILAGLCAGIPMAFNGDTPRSIGITSVQQVGVPPEFERSNPNDSVTPGLDLVFMPPGKLLQIKNFRAALDTFLMPGETFVDFANRGIFHFIFNLPYPAPYPFVHAVNSAIQTRMIQRLEKENPVVVWLSPAYEIDRGPPSLRAYRLWRWLMLRGYRYKNILGFGFLVRPDRLLEKFPNENLDRLPTGLLADAVRPQLDGLPKAWGRSYELLRSKVSEQDLAFTTNTSPDTVLDNDGFFTPGSKKSSLSLIFDVPLIGSDADYLLLELEGKGSPAPRTAMQLSWTDASQQTALSNQNFRFRAAPGTLIIPVGHHPAWLLGRPALLTFSFPRARQDLKWKIKRVAALKLR